jgi:hypothetical protein
LGVAEKNVFLGLADFDFFDKRSFLIFKRVDSEVSITAKSANKLALRIVDTATLDAALRMAW